MAIAQGLGVSDVRRPQDGDRVGDRVANGRGTGSAACRVFAPSCSVMAVVAIANSAAGMRTSGFVSPATARAGRSPRQAASSRD